MPILEEDKRDIPVTVTLKAETLMHLVIASVRMSQISSDETGKMAEAITSTLKL